MHTPSPNSESFANKIRHNPEMFGFYINENRNSFRRLKVAYAHGNYEEIQFWVERIGTSTSMIGDVEISKLSDTIGNKILSGNLNIHKDYEKLLTAFTNLLLKLETEVKFLN